MRILDGEPVQQVRHLMNTLFHHAGSAEPASTRVSPPADGIPSPGDQRYYQGDIGTHGLHLLFQVDSDNARQQVPIDEIVAEQRMVMLPGQQGNVGEQYGREFEKPLLVRVRGGGAAAGSVGG